MPRYEFSAFVTIDADSEHDARDMFYAALPIIEENAVLVTLDDGEPVELDDGGDDE
jgi:hypothetical protein